jgi:opacity protein-like surface antigen
MRKSLVIASLVAASTSMMAMDLQYFLGAGATRVNADYKGTIAVPSVGYSESFSDDMSDTGLTLKTGVILDKSHRISLSYSKFSGEDTDVKVILGNYDYLIPINNDFRLYAGVHAGNAEYKETNTGLADNNEVKMSGLAYGAQVGAIYDITKNIEFELGLAYTKYNVDKSFTGTESGVNYNAKIELEDSTSMSAGINYKF